METEDVRESLLIEEADAWFEYLEATRGQRAGVRLPGVRVIAGREGGSASLVLSGDLAAGGDAAAPARDPGIPTASSEKYFPGTDVSTCVASTGTSRRPRVPVAPARKMRRLFMQSMTRQGRSL